MMEFVLFAGLLGLVYIIVLAWAIMDCANSRRSTAEKLLWIAIMAIFHFIGVLAYVLSSRNKGDSRMKKKKLLRSKNRIIAGVCSGIGEYFEVDPTLVRLLWILATLFSFGSAVLVYIIAWIIIPEK